MATIRLSVLERLKLLDILPQQGDVTTIRIVRRLREALSFSEAEHAALGIRLEGGMIRWDQSQDKALEFGSTARKLVRQALCALNAQQSLGLDLFSLVEKFCPDLIPAEEPEDQVGVMDVASDYLANGVPLAAAID